MDDTLFDHSLTCRDALARVRLEERAFATRPLDELWQEYLRLLDAEATPELSAPPAAYADLRAARFGHLAAHCGWAIGSEKAREISQRYRAEYQRLRRPIPGAVSLVRKVAARTRVGVVTNNQYTEQKEKLQFLRLSDLVDPLIVSAREKVAKPDPRIFRIALERAGVRARETIMVGDSWRNDVLGARAAGIWPVWFNRFGRAPPTRHRVEQIRTFHPVSHAASVLHRAGAPKRRPKGPAGRRTPSRSR
jgi:HAD superfamily hydrolase (TIGR01549 family)